MRATLLSSCSLGTPLNSPTETYTCTHSILADEIYIFFGGVYLLRIGRPICVELCYVDWIFKFYCGVVLIITA